MNKTYPIQRSPLYGLRNRRKLAELFGLDGSYFRREHNYQYSHFDKTKPNGGVRHFANPLGDLKHIQRRIHVLLQRIELPEWVKSGKCGESYINNGRYHIDANYVRTMDIFHFYDSVERNRVYTLFRETFLMADDIATIMTNLVMDGNTLPTGAPSSQLIAFWSYRDMFDEIQHLSKSYGCMFSLYVDDMAFSSKQQIPYAMRDEISVILHNYHMHAERKKDRYYKTNDYKIITGFGFRNGNAYTRNCKKKEIIELYREYLNKPEQVNTKSLKGKLNSAKQNEPSLFMSIVI